MNPRKLSDDFAVTGQITPEQIKAFSAAGYKSILCARPDNEESGQPSFEEVARAAEAEGLQIVHIPVSGMLGEGQIIRFRQAWETMPKPMLGYCRSGARAGSLYATLSR
ncbi:MULTISPECIES: beta-lactamase hydrolase domain-containing protein [Devosiaceae]|uniref:TIGR01244 family phosphatase n=1 Tax=Devosia ginsengisoli TaxID=400770 RepID=A0A5B8LW23_9HYPH|nr:sulfur transferase domain-containing protein [Devosia ginsengisoli]QDZ12568.1 TIGR01244 family phosphatase [Devosia ginsengisoli]